MNSEIIERYGAFLYGASAGLAGKIVSFPFDIVKVRLQNNNIYNGPFDCLKKTLRERGIKALYSGVTFPLAILESSIIFASYSMAYECLKHHKCKYHIASMVAGAFSGISVSFVLTPIELIKCKMQIPNQYKNARSCFISVVKESGLRGLYKGHLSTMMREIPGNMMYFGLYHYIVRTYGKKDIQTWKLACAGSIAGVGYWSLIYPIDTIKTMEQTKSFRGLSSLKIHDLYRGFGITLLRAIPANFTIFYVYEYLNRFP